MSDLKQTPPFKSINNSEAHKEGQEAEAQEIRRMSKRLEREYTDVQ